MKTIKIAIDGPAAAGKSTVAKIVAKELKYVYVDTGAMYRSLTFKALKESVSISNEEKLYNLLKNTTIQLKTSAKGQQVLVDGQDVSEDIRKNEVTNAVSEVSKHALVRKEMVRRQQDLINDGGIVMDGRDIGTHVIPHAELKIFLLASVEERAKRRFTENRSKGYSPDLEKLKEEIQIRDKLDSERKESPLKKADDAIVIDTTSLSINEVAEKIQQLSIERMK
jgi:cytidylate kinase